jgi:hypothetical protein
MPGCYSCQRTLEINHLPRCPLSIVRTEHICAELITQKFPHKCDLHRLYGQCTADTLHGLMRRLP